MIKKGDKVLFRSKKEIIALSRALNLGTSSEWLNHVLPKQRIGKVWTIRGVVSSYENHYILTISHKDEEINMRDIFLEKITSK